MMKTKQEIEQLAQEWCNNVSSSERLAYIDGYTQCQEDNKDKKYTEEDIKEAINMARMLYNISCLEDGERIKYLKHRIKYSNTEDEIINSLNKQD